MEGFNPHHPLLNTPLDFLDDLEIGPAGFRLGSGISALLDLHGSTWACPQPVLDRGRYYPPYSLGDSCDAARH